MLCVGAQVGTPLIWTRLGGDGERDQLMDIERERKRALEQVEQYRSRYREFGAEHFPLVMAIRWCEALQTDPVDWDLLHEIFVTASSRNYSPVADICFFAFCNAMEEMVREASRDLCRAKWPPCGQSESSGAPGEDPPIPRN